jgi:receptor protein-tyrosine kinase
MSIIEKAAARMRTVRQATSVAAGGVPGTAGLADPVGGTTLLRPAVPSSTAASPAERPKAPIKSCRTKATLDFDRLRRLGFVIPGEASPVAEEFRVIKRPLLLNAFRTDTGRIDHGHLIMVTSAQPSEGKTFTAINLALSLAAERDLTVLLVDADAINPSVPPTLGFEAEHGLTDVLADRNIDLADVLVRTNVENLSILPAGSKHPLSNELLASSRMSAFVDDIAERYSDRVIVFDSPPVLATSDPGVLALHVGQIAMVVEANRTGAGYLSDAVRALGSCKNIGLILNKMRSRPLRYEYGRYYAGTRQ